MGPSDRSSRPVCPPINRMCSQVFAKEQVKYVHSSPSSGYPDISFTTMLIQKCFLVVTKNYGCQIVCLGMSHLCPVLDVPSTGSSITWVLSHCSWHTLSYKVLHCDCHSSLLLVLRSSWRLCLLLLPACISLTLAYHPQSNCQAACLNQDLGHNLESCYSHNDHQWSKFLPLVEYIQISFCIPRLTSHPSSVFCNTSLLCWTY